MNRGKMTLRVAFALFFMGTFSVNAANRPPITDNTPPVNVTVNFSGAGGYAIYEGFHSPSSTIKEKVKARLELGQKDLYTVNGLFDSNVFDITYTIYSGNNFIPSRSCTLQVQRTNHISGLQVIYGWKASTSGASTCRVWPKSGNGDYPFNITLSMTR